MQPINHCSVARSPLVGHIERLAQRLADTPGKLDEVLHALEPLLSSVPKPLVEAALAIVAPFLDAMVCGDARTTGRLLQHLSTTVRHPSTSHALNSHSTGLVDLRAD